jgi:hypothetical protein
VQGKGLHTILRRSSNGKEVKRVNRSSTTRTGASAPTARLVERASIESAETSGVETVIEWLSRVSKFPKSKPVASMSCLTARSISGVPEFSPGTREVPDTWSGGVPSMFVFGTVTRDGSYWRALR